jgi:hypothetical protein
MAYVPSLSQICTEAATLAKVDFNDPRKLITALARVLYDAYRAKTGGVSLASGAAIPEWDALRPDIQEAWEASATAALVYANTRFDVTVHVGFRRGV